SRAAMSGSISSSPATLRCSKVSCATLTVLTLLGTPDEGQRRVRADRPLAQHARLQAGQVDDRRGKPGELARVEHGSAPVLDLEGHVADAARRSAAGEVGARRHERTGLAQDE